MWIVNEVKQKYITNKWEIFSIFHNAVVFILFKTVNSKLSKRKKWTNY